jgi:hypothetical protein
MLMVEAEISVIFYQTTRHNMPEEDGNLFTLDYRNMSLWNVTSTNYAVRVQFVVRVGSFLQHQNHLLSLSSLSLFIASLSTDSLVAYRNCDRASRGTVTCNLAGD